MLLPARSHIGWRQARSKSVVYRAVQHATLAACQPLLDGLHLIPPTVPRAEVSRPSPQAAVAVATAAVVLRSIRSETEPGEDARRFGKFGFSESLGVLCTSNARPAAPEHESKNEHRQCADDYKYDLPRGKMSAGGRR